VARLAAYDDALATGAALPGLPTGDAEDVAFLELLNQVLTRRPAGGSAQTADGGPRYLLRGVHANGGIGQVWLAHDTELGRDIALKVLRPDRAGDPMLQARFVNEARVTSRLQHPGIVPVYELAPAAGADGEPPFYTMRLVQGRTLTEAIAAYHARRAAGAASSVERATLLNAFVSVCNTVAYAHACGVIHRDLKPANVALGDYGEVVVLDWGFAKKVVGNGPPTVSHQTDETWSSVPSACATAPAGQSVAGQVLGTPAYMAPEQAEGRGNDESADVYGLGAILYELLTGQPPYPGTDTAEVLRQVRAGQPPRPSAVIPTVPPALEAVCVKAMARDPSERYPSAAALAGEVQHWLADEPVEAYPEPAGARLRRWGRRHPALAAGTAALLLTGLLAAFLGEALLRREQTRAAEERLHIATVHTRSMDRAQEEVRRELYLHRLALAERTLDAHNPIRALALLQECPAALRGWEWHCLSRLGHSGQPLLSGHTATVQSLAFHPLGHTLASAGFDGVVRFWDAATGHATGHYEGHSAAVYDLAYSPDGRHLATASWDGTVRIWDITTGQTIHILPGHTERAESVAYSPDGRFVYSRSGNNVVRRWDAVSGRPLHTATPGGAAWSLAVNPVDGRVVVGCTDGTVRLLEPETLGELRVLTGHRYSVRAVAFSPDGRRLASGDGDFGRGDTGEVRVWDCDSGALVHTFAGHTEAVMRVAFGAGGQRLASASFDNTVKLWDLATGQETLTLHGHTEAVRCVAFSPDGLRLASGGADRVIRLWDATPWPESKQLIERLTLKGHVGRALAVAYRPDGGQLASVGEDPTLLFWEPDRSAPLRSIDLSAFGDELPWAGADYFAVAFDEAGRRCVVTNGMGTVATVDATTGQLLRVMKGHSPGVIRGLALRPGGKQVATGSWDRTVRIWDLDSGREAVQLEGRHTEPVNSVAYSPDGRWLATASNDQSVRLWDADSGRELRPPLTGFAGAVLGVAVSPDGAWLATAGNDGLVRLWDTATWQEARTLRGHELGVRSVVFSPDGRHLASAGHDWTVRLWDVPDGAQRAVFRGHANRVHSLAFSPDGRTLASAGYDGDIKLWDVSQFSN
jgi:WD40 repeat protein